ncbi:hypothetical protein A6R68_07048 [Neotoma lepida]|uniref:Uncharacterized protein n=1 Tax=Neotoma lepida TaxID=56216 RepID=A0A1A6GDW6_NEOLE|nr:hypothetical protein A6R68_07048 [Neotoma lepida]
MILMMKTTPQKHPPQSSASQSLWSPENLAHPEKQTREEIFLMLIARVPGKDTDG